MTQEKFLRELSRRASQFPPDECKRMVEYYRELIADKLEAGGIEEEIIAAFGPIDEIVHQALPGGSENRPASAPQSQSFVGSRAYAILLLCTSPVWLAVGVALLAVYVSVWAVLSSLFVSGGAMVLAGAVYVAPSALLLRTNVPVAIVQMAVCALTAGLGLLLLAGMWELMRLFGRYTRWQWKRLGHLLPKKLAREGEL